MPTSEQTASRGRRELADRILRFGVATVELAHRIPADRLTRHIPNQLVRAATYVGANYAEAGGAAGRREFVGKLRIADREAREARFWLDFAQHQWPNLKGVEDLLRESEELVCILSASIRTATARGE